MLSNGSFHSLTTGEIITMKKLIADNERLRANVEEKCALSMISLAFFEQLIKPSSAINLLFIV